tara:strand:+ start:72229 stop:73203 length:975 start_codon:yes stop_codon:yes gene_type:complete
MNLFISDEYSPSAKAILKSQLADANIVEFNPKTVKSADLESAEGLLIRSSFSIHKSLLDQLPHLKWVVTSTSGFDHIDLTECSKRDIKVSFTPEGNIQSVLELTLWFLIEGQRRVTAFRQLVEKRKWKRDGAAAQECRGKTLGIIGYGRIGSRVADLAQSLGMQVVVHDPYINPKILEDKDIESLGVSEIFRMSDILTLHVPFTSTTREMVNEKTLELMPSHSFLINTSRGSIVKEVALIEALKSQQIGGAALDVFASEPLPSDSALRNLPNLVMTPHIGAYTEQAFAAVSRQAVEQTIAFFKHEQHHNPLPPSSAWFTAEMDS